MKNSNLFHSINLEYGFLEDFEEEYKYGEDNYEYFENMKKKAQQIKRSDEMEKLKNKKYYNNYPEYSKPLTPEQEKLKEIEENKDIYRKTAQGKFSNNIVDKDKVNDLDYLYKNLEVDKNTESPQESVEKLDHESLKDVKNFIKEQEIKLYAFLNKEFNILNKKMIGCCAMCYDNPKMFTTYEAKLCAETCNSNIKQAAIFASKLQEEKTEKLDKCIEKAWSLQGSKGIEQTQTFFECYKELTNDLLFIQSEIKNEFSNYI